MSLRGPAKIGSLSATKPTSATGLSTPTAALPPASWHCCIKRSHDHPAGRFIVCPRWVTATQAGQIAWLDARHRSHVNVENDVKQAKALGLNRWPSRHWAINVAWTQIVALAANLLACFRHLALPPGELREAAPKLLRFRLLHLPARLTRGQRKRWLHLHAGWPWTADLIGAWHAVKALPAPA